MLCSWKRPTAPSQVVFIALDHQPANNIFHSDDSDDEWHGITPPSRPGDRSRNEEYENEEVFATVTVIEDFEPEITMDGSSHLDSCAERLPESEPRSARIPHPKPKSKSRKVRYETKDARRKERTKQRARKLEKAERAGGKAGSKKRKH